MKKYILHKTVRDPSGNLHWARTTPYDEGDLPAKVVKDPTLVTVIDVETHVAVSKSVNPEQEVRHLNPTQDSPTPLVSSFVEPTPTIISRLDINTASLEDIKNIKGIAEKTATLIIASRPYESMADLNTKVKPPLGKTWADFHFKYGSTEE
jgi:hypothetical protein